MTNEQHVYEFCNNLKTSCGAAFQQVPMPNGVKITGEYLSYSGQPLSIMIDMYRSRVEIKVYDPFRRLIFNERFSGNINNNRKLRDFIEKSRMHN